MINLAAVPSAREYVRDVDVIPLLSQTTDFEGKGRKHQDEDMQILEFQRLKARMALAYLVGSEGHFGQPCSRSSLLATESVFCDGDDNSGISQQDLVFRFDTVEKEHARDVLQRSAKRD